MLRQRLLPIILAAAPLAFAGCESAPPYTIEPVIEFKSIKAERQTFANGSTPANLVTITIKYKDGDGDLGLSEDDRKNPPFNDTRPTADNEYYTNYHINLYWATPTGDFQLYQPPGNVPYGGAFERLMPADAKPQPIRGDLDYYVGGRAGTLKITNPEFRPGNRLRFEIYIYDRALHKSNVITTDEVVLQ